VRGGSTPPGATSRESPARCAGHDDFPAFAFRSDALVAATGEARRGGGWVGPWLRNDWCTRGSATRPEWRAGCSSSRCLELPARPRRAHSSDPSRRRSTRRAGERRARSASNPQRASLRGKHRWPSFFGFPGGVPTTLRMHRRGRRSARHRRHGRPRSFAAPYAEAELEGYLTVWPAMHPEALVETLSPVVAPR
jgi:hypothetical protein